MKKIESFKTFSQVQNQIREEARQKEIASKREASVAVFNELLSKYNASSIEDLNEEEKDEFLAALTKEGNAFGAARAEAIAKGDDSFKVGDEEMPVKNVDKEDEENAEEFVEESVVTEGKHDEMLDKVADAVKNASNFMNVGIALKDAGIKYDFSTGMMPIYKLQKYPIAIVNKKYVDKGDREVGDIAIGVMESLTESLITEALEGRAQKDAMKGYAAIHKFMMAHPAFNSKTITDPTVAWVMKLALKEALINANFHNEAAKVGKAINFAGFSEPVIFVKEMGGMPLPIKKGMMMDKAYDLAQKMSAGAKYNGYAIIEAVAMFFDERFPKTSVAANLREMLDSFMGEATEAGNLEQRINEGSAFNSARLKAIEAGEDEFEFDGKKYPVKNVDKEDKELAKELVDEGSAFNSARLKAIAADEDEFEFDGKKYPVKSVGKEDKELAKEITERLDNSTMKRMSGLSDQKELKKFKEAFVNMAQSFYEEGFEFDEVLDYMDAVLRDPNIRGSIEEGNAFLGARAKAIEEDAEEFEFNGKKYPVTVKESNETETVFEAFVEIDSMDPDAPELEKLLKKNKVEMEVMSYGGPTYATPIIRLEGKEKDVIKVLMDQKAGWGMPKSEAEYLVEESVHTDINESYAERLLKDFEEFIKRAENKMVKLTVTEFDGTSTVEGKLKKGNYGLHKIDFMGFNFEDELESIKSGEGMIMGVRPGNFLKYKIGPGKYGSEFLIEVL